MHSYFEKMKPIGSDLAGIQLTCDESNEAAVREEESAIAEAIQGVIDAGLPAEKLHQRGQNTAMERLHHLVDEGTFLPLNSLFDPAENSEKSVGVVSGLAEIGGRSVIVIASDNRVLAGAWVPGQAEKVFRAQDMAERLNLPLIWLLNCSGIKLTQQEALYSGRRSGGRSFFRHADLNLQGVPVLAAVFGTNPAGGGYHGISPTAVFAHCEANMAVGGAGIVSGMSPKGHFDAESAAKLIEATLKFKATPPGGVGIHRDHTGFFSSVHQTEEELLDKLASYVAELPAYGRNVFRVAEPAEPAHPADDLYQLVPHNQKQVYSIEEVLARLLDASQHMEYRPDYGPEVYTGLARVDGYPIGIIANRQGFLGSKYPSYAEGEYFGFGGKLYREGLIKMNEMVSACGRDKIPVVWIQDTTGIDVGDLAEKAELLGLGQSLIYSIEDSGVPMMCIVLRKGCAATHYVMGGPQANRNNAFTLGTATTEIYVMHGETAAVAAYARRLTKESQAERDIQPVLDKMNALAQQYHDQSRPEYCARAGLVDEIVDLTALRKYLVAFARGVFQNPRSVCPPHQMMLPRSIRG
jgi:glutaconyl-CoA decarboxylase